jgi:nitrite reductase/ring-hydroxylating ferredoxin subunit
VSVVLPFVAVARLDQIPQDRGLRVVIDGIGVGLYRVGDAIHAMEDACPHAGYPLSEGELAGSVIACRAHGWPFDVRTGFDPDNADGFPVPCFAVEVEGNEVRIDLTDQINDPRRNRSLRQKRPRLGH